MLLEVRLKIDIVGGTSSATSDPCPGYRKYVEVAFKCRPTQFREEKYRSLKKDVNMLR